MQENVFTNVDVLLFCVFKGGLSFYFVSFLGLLICEEYWLTDEKSELIQYSKQYGTNENDGVDDGVWTCVVLHDTSPMLTL